MRDMLTLRIRMQVEVFRAANEWAGVEFEKEFVPTSTAILICDMWDKHWCRGASQRVAEMAPRMNTVVEHARLRGIRIIHAPSDTMAFYANTPWRQTLKAVPPITPPEALHLTSPPLPIDDSDGGCDTDDSPYTAWRRQHPAITISREDVISDDGLEIYRYLMSRGIELLVFMGVHTNKCILDRSFGIKMMTRWGVKCILARDLTDALYNPQSPPYISQEEGTRRIIHHIEKYWCPSISSQDLIRPSRAAS